MRSCVHTQHTSPPQDERAAGARAQVRVQGKQGAQGARPQTCPRIDNRHAHHTTDACVTQDKRHGHNTAAEHWGTRATHLRPLRSLPYACMARVRTPRNAGQRAQVRRGNIAACAVGARLRGSARRLRAGQRAGAGAVTTGKNARRSRHAHLCAGRWGSRGRRRPRRRRRHLLLLLLLLPRRELRVVVLQEQPRATRQRHAAPAPRQQLFPCGRPRGSAARTHLRRGRALRVVLAWQHRAVARRCPGRELTSLCSWIGAVWLTLVTGSFTTRMAPPRSRRFVLAWALACCCVCARASFYQCRCAGGARGGQRARAAHAGAGKQLRRRARASLRPTLLLGLAHSPPPPCALCSVPKLDTGKCPDAISDAAIAQGFCVKTFNSDLKKPRGLEVSNPARSRPQLGAPRFACARGVRDCRRRSDYAAGGHSGGGAGLHLAGPL